MKRFALAGLLAFCTIVELYAWDLIQAKGGRTNSLGRCSVALSDFWSLHNNSAGAASCKDLKFGISYENRFLLKELNVKDAGLLIPLNYGTIGISISQFGYEHYNENAIGLGISRSFGEKIKIGLNLYYLLLRFSDSYSNKSAPTFDIGFQYKLNESLCLGAYFFNPINVKINTINKDKIPVIIRFGISYLVVDNFMFCCEIEENLDDNFSFRFGFEYEIFKNVYIRSGFQFKPEFFTFGIGYNYEWFTVDVAAQMNQDLGATLTCSMIFNITKRKIT